MATSRSGSGRLSAEERAADYRRGRPTPYMNELRVPTPSDAADPDTRILSDSDLEQATREGQGTDAE